MSKYSWRVKIREETRPIISEMAEVLGFWRSRRPSPPKLLDALATAYQRDPTAVINALRSLGVAGDVELQNT